MKIELTQYGFRMGPLEVNRTMVLPEERPVVTVKTPYRELDIYASKTGRSLRVFEKGGGELK